MAVMDSIAFLTEVSPMTAPTRQPSLTDLPDDQWDILPPLIPTSKPGGRPREVDMREVINTILYLNRTGCQGDMLPHALRPKSSVDEYLATWRREGTWQHMLDALRAAVRTPQAPSPEPPPSAASLESQAVKTTAQGGDRGDDGGKKIKGRTRPVSVDTLGLWLVVFVSSAAGMTRWPPHRCSSTWAMRPLHVWKCCGPIARTTITVSTGGSQPSRRATGAWKWCGVPRGARASYFCPSAGSWNAPWLGLRCRRHSKDYERRTDSSEAMVRVRAIPLMLKRLNPSDVCDPSATGWRPWDLSGETLREAMWHTNSLGRIAPNDEAARRARSAVPRLSAT